MNYLSREVHSALSTVISSGSYFGIQLIPWIAVASSVFFAFSPWHTIEKIRQARSTLRFSFTPYYFYTLQSVLFLLYAYSTSNMLLSFTTSLGCALGAYYVKIFYQFTSDKTTPLAYIGAGTVISLALTWEALTRSEREAQFLIGIAGNIVMILTAASPLSELKTVLRDEDASIFPFGMSLMNALAGGIWTLYGIILEDIVVVFPNFVALIMGIIQLWLIYMYPGKKLEKVEMNAEELKIGVHHL